MQVLNHIGLAVTDIYRSTEFYCDCLDFVIGEQFSGKDLKILLLHNGATVLELLQKQNDPLAPRCSGVWDHITFQVDDIDAMYRKLQTKNVGLLDKEPRLSVFGKRILFFAGPDGERIELLEK